MPGFLGIVADNQCFDYSTELLHREKTGLIVDQLKTDKYKFTRFVNKKFINDKVYFENNEYFLFTDGVLLNSNDLKRKYKKDTLEQTIIKMYESNGDTFFEEIRGSYSCILFDKRNDRWLGYTDQLGDKKVYYYQTDNGIIFSSEIVRIVHVLKEMNIDLELDYNSTIALLTLGFMVDDHTLLKGIKKLTPGQYIKYENQEVHVETYFELNNDPIIEGTEEEIIDRLDQLFRNAIRLQFEKDREYGYKHIASISGGLDSRMVNIVAHDLGYEDILNYTFSQSNYLDEKIGKQIAIDLNHEFIFKSLDDAKFLFEVENIININGGTSIYYGLAHSKNNLEALNLGPYGLVHTGQIGDVVVGTFSKTPHHTPIEFTQYTYSNMYKHRLEQIPFKEYPNDEIFKMYNRGFNFALNGNLSFQQFTESFSPFCNVDFLQYCLNIPLKYRVNHELYYKWILTKYPKAADYVYEKIKSKITTPKSWVWTKNMSIRVANKALNTFSLPTVYGYNTKRGMNPFDYWYRKNKKLKNFMDHYYSDNIDRIKSQNKASQELKAMCENMYNKGIAVEKLQVLTLLATVNLFLGEIHD